MKQWKGCRMSYITTHSTALPLLHLRRRHFTYSFSNPSAASSTPQLILQPFRRFTYVTGHSTTLPLLHLRRNSFSDPSAALPTSQLILQPFRRFTYVTAHSTALPLLHLYHRYLPTSQILHLRHLASRPCPYDDV